MSWTDIFPVFSPEEVESYQSQASDEDKEFISSLFEVEEIFNPQHGGGLVATSLFWKNSTAADSEIQSVSLETFKNAHSLGLSTRYDPWKHYVEPLLEGIKSLAASDLEAIFRVYLANDLDFLVESFTRLGAEVYLMKTSSIRHNPGAMWRFLAFEEPNRAVTVVDADRASEAIHDVRRTIVMRDKGLGLWRFPYIFNLIKNDSHPGFYRPINACQFGAVGGILVRELMEAFVWISLKGRLHSQCTFQNEGEVELVQIQGCNWPDYGFDEWFLQSALYPRFAQTGVITFIALRESALNHWFSLDIEYVTWANPSSEIVYVGRSSFGATNTKSDITGFLNRTASETSERRFSVVDSRTRSATDTKTIVINRKNESLSWIRDLPDDISVVIYNGGETIIDQNVRYRADKIIDLGGAPAYLDPFLLHLRMSDSPPSERTIYTRGDPFIYQGNFMSMITDASFHLPLMPISAGISEFFRGMQLTAPPATAGLYSSIQPNRELGFTRDWELDPFLIRTDLYSTYTLDLLSLRDNGGSESAFEYAIRNGLPKGSCIAAHFLEFSGFHAEAEAARNKGFGQAACGSMFIVHNGILNDLKLKDIDKMLYYSARYRSYGELLSRLWLHILGQPFLNKKEI